MDILETMFGGDISYCFRNNKVSMISLCVLFLFGGMIIGYLLFSLTKDKCEECKVCDTTKLEEEIKYLQILSIYYQYRNKLNQEGLDKINELLEKDYKNDELEKKYDENMPEEMKNFRQKILDEVPQ